MLNDDSLNALLRVVFDQQLKWDLPFDPTKEQSVHMERFNTGVAVAGGAVREFFENRRGVLLTNKDELRDALTRVGRKRFGCGAEPQPLPTGDMAADLAAELGLGDP